MIKRKKITKLQKAKVDEMAAYLKEGTLAPDYTDAENDQPRIQIKTDTTHLEFFTACFQNVTGFYLIQGVGGAGDKLRFTDIHPIYVAALKDKDFNAYMMADKVEKGSQGSSKAPADGPSALKGQNTAPDGNLDKGGK